MDKSTFRWAASAVVLGLGLGLTGCGDDKKVEPKANKDAKQLQPQTPGGPQDKYGKAPPGPKGGVE
jgi:hypothetical protein